METMVNCTPHDITVAPSGATVSNTLPPSGLCPRVSMTRVQVGHVTIPSGGSVPVYKTVPGTVEDLPDRAQGTVYIVSRMVAEACPARDDLIFPDDMVRDEAGRVVGCRAFGGAFNAPHVLFAA